MFRGRADIDGMHRRRIPVICSRKARSTSHHDTLGQENRIVKTNKSTSKHLKATTPGAERIRKRKLSRTAMARERALKLTTAPAGTSPTDEDSWSLEAKGRPDLTELKNLILKRAGLRFQRNEFLCIEFSLHTTKRLLEEGHFFPGENALLFPQEDSQCHVYSALLGADPRAERWTGFALSSDGCWRSHSWVVRKKDRRLIEATPVPRTMYFGVQIPIPAEHAEMYAAERVAEMPNVKTLFEDQLPTDSPNHPSI